MTKTYTVNCIEMCPDCSGYGVIQNPMWKKLWADAEDSELTQEFVENWAIENCGGMTSLGLEELACDNCNGTGKLSYPVPLMVALRNLRVMV